MLSGSWFGLLATTDLRRVSIPCSREECKHGVILICGGNTRQIWPVEKPSECARSLSPECQYTFLIQILCTGTKMYSIFFHWNAHKRECQGDITTKQGGKGGRGKTKTPCALAHSVRTLIPPTRRPSPSRPLLLITITSKDAPNLQVFWPYSLQGDRGEKQRGLPDCVLVD
jgi:hypothetical protein